MIENFQQMIDNIFEPLFEVTKDPATHPQLHVLLSQVWEQLGGRLQEAICTSLPWRSRVWGVSGV